VDLARGCHEAPPERIGFSLSSITEISVIDLGSRSEIALIRGGDGVRRDSRGMEAKEWTGDRWLRSWKRSGRSRWHVKGWSRR
jgi:hypothetical protein